MRVRPPPPAYLKWSVSMAGEVRGLLWCKGQTFHREARSPRRNTQSLAVKSQMTLWVS